MFPAALASGALPPLPVPDHVVIVIEENHSEQNIIGNASAPYMNFLANSGADFTNFYAITHPSQPNYLQLFSGSAQGVTDDSVPTGTPYSTANLGAEIRAAGKTFIGYSEDLPSVGFNGATSGNYARKHNPWADWQSATTPLPANQLPTSVNQPFTAFPSNFSLLPTVSFVVPNLQDDMHDGTIAQGDTWLNNNISAYATWAQTHNSLLIVTWDEDDHGQLNKIPAFFDGPMVRQGAVAQTYTLQNLLRTVEDMYGTTHAGNAANVNPIRGIWTTDPLVATKTFQRGTNGTVQDTYIDATNPSTSFATTTSIGVDGSPVNQGLIRFDNLFGVSAGQIPAGATITGATLTIITGPGTNDLSTNNVELHRMLTNWSESSTYNSLTGGITLGTDAATTVDGTALPNALSIATDFDVTSTVQLWANGTSNFGWALMPTGSDGWRWNSSETAQSLRPSLTITYVVPEPGSALVATGAMIVLSRRSRKNNS